MTKKLLFVLTLLISETSFGQNINDSLLATFYNKTLVYYFSDTSIDKDQAKFGCILIQTKFDTTRLIKNSGKNLFKFLTSKTNINSVLTKPYKINNDRNIYFINDTILKRDTVDILIGGWTLGNVTRKNISFGMWCGGWMGYIPDGRFIYNKDNGTWTSISGHEIIKEMKK